MATFAAESKTMVILVTPSNGVPKYMQNIAIYCNMSMKF